ncbi:ceramide-1-phosphate transfer protein-like [Lytechinus variegatus]|uniref:ceramide-1-phosphate transfer protein-like n=1 Tax=Lytechinus variegatus TaxID=7654 RepID=UPI001BB2B82B|nr:ceramide-1-phosphate transfer protein-like [Lytechinus variegatus]XP_041467120.1 ceramide-1-phosphate transfer protein-like [Lytechinus variegatus]
MAPNGFDLEKIRREFTAALHEDGTIDLDHYLCGHCEITRLLSLLGTVFGFVASDMKTKCNIIDSHREDHPEEFTTVQTMIDYEMRENLTARKDEKGRDSGCRTFLRLHRALEFFCVLLKRLKPAKGTDPTSTLTSKTYGETLGKYHPWVVRQMAYLAIKTLPNKQQLIHRYCLQDAEEAQALVILSLQAMEVVYDKTQDILAHHDLLNLP